MRPLRVLAVHGYWWGPDSKLAMNFNTSVCEFVAGVHTNYDLILLLSGWGQNGRKDTIAELQRDTLTVCFDVPPERIKFVLYAFTVERLRTQAGFEFFGLPPLDTWQEVDEVKEILLVLGIPGAKVDVVTMRWHATRTGVIYRRKRVKVGKLFRVDGPLTVTRFVHEVAGLLIALVDRDGQGVVLRYERLKRLKEMRQAKKD